jgi:hypothetical protein
MRKLANFSPCRSYRYSLFRIWDEAEPRRLVVIGLNPSTADETQDDPTIRRCVNFAKREQCGSLVMLNLFAYRATKPDAMMRRACPVSEPGRHFDGRSYNDVIILSECQRGPDVLPIVVAAWGANGHFQHRDQQVRSLLLGSGVTLYRFGAFTAGGQPRHPLYLRADTQLEVWS